MNRAALVATAGLLVATSVATAGPFQADRVASTAKWVAHVDVQAAMKTELAKFVMRQPVVAEHVEKAVRRSVAKLGLDPTRDLDSITVYGTGYEPRAAVAIVTGRFDRQKLLALIPKDGHQQENHGNATVHSWQNPKGGVSHGCFFNDETLVLANDLDNLKTALDVLTGQADDVSKGELAPLLPVMAAGTIFMMAGRDLQLPDDRAGGMIRRFVSLAAVAGEDGENAFAQITGQARDVQSAENVRRMLNGLLAMAALSSDQAGDARLSPLAALAGGITVGGQDATVTVSASFKVARLKDVIEHLLSPAAERHDTADPVR